MLVSWRLMPVVRQELSHLPTSIRELFYTQLDSIRLYLVMTHTFSILDSPFRLSSHFRFSFEHGTSAKDGEAFQMNRDIGQAVAGSCRCEVEINSSPTKRITAMQATIKDPTAASL